MSLQGKIRFTNLIYPFSILSVFVAVPPIDKSLFYLENPYPTKNSVCTGSLLLTAYPLPYATFSSILPSFWMGTIDINLDPFLSLNKRPPPYLPVQT